MSFKCEYGRGPKIQLRDDHSITLIYGGLGHRPSSLDKLSFSFGLHLAYPYFLDLMVLNELFYLVSLLLVLMFIWIFPCFSQLQNFYPKTVLILSHTNPSLKFRPCPEISGFTPETQAWPENSEVPP